MTYQTSRHINHEDGAEALKFAGTILAEAGFAIQERTASTLVAIGPGMNSSRQNPLRAASRISLRIQGEDLSVCAELNGAKRLFITLAVVFGIMAFCFAAVAVFAPSHHSHGDSMPMAIRLLIAVGPFAPWPFLFPLIYRMTRNAGRRAVDNLAQNSAIMPVKTRC